MKTLSIDLPDNLVAAIHGYIKAGYFNSEPEVLMAALLEFVRRNRVDLMEQFAHEDIEWAKRQVQRNK